MVIESQVAEYKRRIVRTPEYQKVDKEFVLPLAVDLNLLFVSQPFATMLLRAWPNQDRSGYDFIFFRCGMLQLRHRIEGVRRVYREDSRFVFDCVNGNSFIEASDCCVVPNRFGARELPSILFGLGADPSELVIKRMSEL